MTGLLTNISYQAVAIVYFIFSGIFIGRGSRSPVAWLFCVATVVTAVWAQSYVLSSYDIVPRLAFDLAGAVLDGAWIAFALGLIYPLSGRRLYWRAAAITASVVIALQLLFYSTGLSFGRIAGISLDITLLQVATTLFSFVLIENVLRNGSRGDFWAVKHWAIGLAAILAFELVIRIPEFLTHSDNPSLTLANPLVVLIALPFFVISSARLPQIQLRIASSRAFVFQSATLIAVGVLLQGTAFAAWYVRTYGGSNGTALALTIVFTGFVAVLAAVTSGTVRSYIRLMINKHLFSLKFDYRVEWERAIRSLTAGPEKNVAERALRTLCDLMDAPGGAIWLYQESWRQYRLAGKLNVSPSIPSLKDDDDWILRLRGDDRPFVVLSGKGQHDLNFARMKEFIGNGWIVLPLRYRSALAGFIILDQPRVPRELDWEDENLVQVLSMQVAAYVVQEETAQSLADARQLEDFNKRFAFVVHDIKNVIGQLSLLVRNIAQFGDQKEFRDDMVVTLGNSVDRLGVLLQSLTAVGAKGAHSSGAMQGIELSRLLADFVAKKKDLGYRLELLVPPNPLTLTTDYVALSRVLEHVVSNAVEASEPQTPVEIELSETDGLVEIVVADRGAGMTQQFINEELFRPLRSTKHGGFGVGGYQIRELMRDIGGDVSVESVVGSGTRVVLSMPRALASATT